MDHSLISIDMQMTSNEMNVVMKRLTLATIIFLPLTLLTGYFVSPAVLCEFTSLNAFFRA
jgi:hypothetical protein